MKLIERIIAKPILEEMSREKLPEGVLCRVSYPICDIGKRNANDRVYEDAVFDKVLEEKDLKEKLENRALFGHAEHPEQTQTNLEKTSHVIFEMWKDDGQVWQKFDVLDTPTGQIVDCLLRAGCRVGCSTRAEGDLEEAEDDSGTFHRVIPESYNYVSTDFTADPSTFGSIPYDIKRSVVTEVKKLLESKDAEESEKEFATCLLGSMKCKKAVIAKCQKCGCCEALKENKQYIMEGVWALPNTTARAKKLAELMENPINPKEATDKLYDLVGDDLLFDSFHEAEDNKVEDIRPEVKAYIKGLLERYNEKSEDFKQKFEDGAVEILQSIIAEKKTILDLINDKLIQVGKVVEYKNQTCKVTKIEEGKVSIEIPGMDSSGGKQIEIDGAARITIEVDGRININPEPESTAPASVLDVEAPPVVEPGTASAVIIGDEAPGVDEIPEAEGIPPTASPHIQDGYWYDAEGDQVKVVDSTTDLLTIKPEKGKTEKISLKDFTDKYSRRESESIEVGATVKIEEGEHKDKEGKITKIEESGITIALDDGTVVSIEDPSAVNITVTAPAPAEEIEPVVSPEHEIEDIGAARPLPIVKDVPEEEFESKESITEDVSEKLAAGNLLQDKDGKDWTVKEAGDGALTITQPGEPGTEKRIAWGDVESHGFTKVSEAIEEDVSHKQFLVRRIEGLKKEKANFEKENQRKLDQYEKELEALEAEGSGVKEATSVEKNGEWFVESPSGAILGGPYKSKIVADKRKKDVEFYAASKESKVDETADIKAMYKAADLPAPDGKGIHTKAFHELVINVAKGYVKGGDTSKEALKKAYPTAMKQLGKEKAVKKPHQKSESESISTTAKEIKDLRVEEASTRAERDKAIELLEEITDDNKQLVEKVRKEKAFEIKILVNRIGKTLESKEQEVDALRAKLEEKAELAAKLAEDNAELYGELDEQNKLATKRRKMLDEVKTNLSNDIKSLKESVSATENKHQKDLSEAEKKYQKELDELTKANETKIEKTKEETELRVKEEVTEKFVKSFIEFKLSETALKVDDNSQALLEKCKSLGEVEELLDEIVDAGRRSALHSESITSIRVTEHKVADPEREEAERRVGNAFDGMNV